MGVGHPGKGQNFYQGQGALEDGLEAWLGGQGPLGAMHISFQELGS